MRGAHSGCFSLWRWYQDSDLHDVGNVYGAYGHGDTAVLLTDEPWDKAGAYAIQGYAGAFVSQIRGSYSAVVGLPLCETRALLIEAGVTVRHG